MATNARDGDAAVGALLDELLLDIFARLPDPVDLLRCAGTCTRWFRLLAADDTAFLRRAGVLPENRKATLLLGAFYQNDYVVPESATTVNNVPDCPPRFWRLDDLARPGIGLFSKHDGLFNYAKPLASRQDLLLVRLMPAPPEHRKLHLAVCHPLLAGVHLVPPPPLHFHPPLLGRDLTGYALITGNGGECLENRRQRRLAFRVLFTVVRLDGIVCAYSYSSATCNWSAPIMCPLQLRGLTLSGPRAGVVDDRGTAHWLYRSEMSFYTLDVSADAARVSLTKTPIRVEYEQERRVFGLQPPFPCIARGGNLSLVLSRKPASNMLKLYTKRDQDENNQGWIHYELPLFQRSSEPISLTGFRVFAFQERKGALLVKTCSGTFSLDLGSMELEMLRGSDCSSNTYPSQACYAFGSTCHGYTSCAMCAYNNSVLYEIDWSSYLLHISAWTPRGI